MLQQPPSLARTTPDPRTPSSVSRNPDFTTHRPTYIPAAVTHLLHALNLLHNRHAKILDMATGAGKFTEILAARDEEYKIVAVELHKNMRRVLRGGEVEGTTVVGGDLLGGRDVSKGEGMELKGWADAVVVAQAFHWFSSLPALRSMHRFLHPNGTFGLIWNPEDYNQPPHKQCHTPWETGLRNLLLTIDDRLPRYPPAPAELFNRAEGRLCHGLVCCRV
ncbi:hypothetical protein BDZ91DRAFT_681459 [Kalaharituber pfeilii]|nr:hypothetical protein BDZ91DRAFT_681459 [Kalaharituber pfeilii]